MELYRSFDIWKRTGSNSVVRYRCFEDLATGRFIVQNSDHFHARKEIGIAAYEIHLKELLGLEAQYVALLIEEAPTTRSGSFATIDEAILDHDKAFA